MSLTDDKLKYQKAMEKIRDRFSERVDSPLHVANQSYEAMYEDIFRSYVELGELIEERGKNE